MVVSSEKTSGPSSPKLSTTHETPVSPNFILFIMALGVSLFTFGFFFFFFSGIFSFSSTLTSSSLRPSFFLDTSAALPIPFISSPVGIVPNGDRSGFAAFCVHPLAYCYDMAFIYGKRNEFRG
jgi:hypothetical protein